MSRAFTVELADLEQQQRWEDAEAFQGRDATGSFAIWAGHQDFMARCPAGVSRIRCGSEWVYLAAPSLLVVFHRGQMSLTCRRYFLGESPAELEQKLIDWTAQDNASRHLKALNQTRLEQSFMRRLRELKSDDLS